MATPTSGKSRYDKEMSAVTYNMKEQRVLEKSLQTLKLEQRYAIKLLELDNRIIKVQYKKLKERVSRIKSHLPVEDITKFRELDAKGKIKPAYGSVSLGSATKIAAASRRLNLNSGKTQGRTSARGALPRISVQPDGNNDLRSKSSVSFGKTSGANPSKLRRSNSVTGVFMDAPQPSKTQRPGSAVLPQTNGFFRNGAPLFNKEDPDLLMVEEANELNSVSPEKDSLLVPNGETSEKKEETTRTASAIQHSRSPFSSHSTGVRMTMSATIPRHDQPRCLSRISNDSIDSNLGENIFEERRQELLEEEGVRAAVLDKRTKEFLKDVDEYLLQNPPLQTSHVAFETAPTEPNLGDAPERPSTTDGNGINKLYTRFQRRSDRPGGGGDGPTFLPEDNYKQRLMALWKDMNKCRYLRLPDEKIDLSGVNTLVKDQMKLFETLKNAERAPLTGAWDI